MSGQTWFIPFIVVAVGGLVTFIIFAAIKHSKKQKARLQEVAMSLGAEFLPGNWKIQPAIRGKIGRKDFKLTFHVVSTGQSSVTYLDLETPVETMLEKLEIRKVGGARRFFKKMGLAKALDSGDPYFDAKVAVRGKPEQSVLAILYGGYFKDPAGKLTSHGFAVSLKKGGLIASKIYNRKKDMQIQTIHENLDSLVALANAVENKS